MQFSEFWLREWVNPSISSQVLADQLSLAGLEVDALSPLADFSGVVVAEIVGCERHPDADKLRVCQVQADEEEPLQIVCGAPNARVGIKVPLAKVNAVLPGGFKIKKAKLRGVPSYGMLCGANELAIGEDTGGLMELAESLTVGQELKTALDLNDHILEVDLTPNRSDCLSIQGIAREIAAINQVELTPVSINPVAVSSEKTLSVTLDSDICGYYCGQLIEGIQPSASTPEWMVEKLRRSDVQSVNLVADVTNYVMLELGQPLHGFDADKLSGGITVRMAKAGETLALLNDKTIELDDQSLVIADDANPLALAGIMGGESSSISDSTSSVFIESAFFDPTRMAGKARHYGLHTDSSHRFERGVDPELAKIALHRAVALIVEIAGGQAGPIVEQGKAGHIQARAPIALTPEKVNRVLGTELSDEKMVAILEGLNFNVENAESGWSVTAPSYRFDIERDVDLIEEIARLFGYNNLPVRSLKMDSLSRVSKQESWVTQRALKNLLIARDYQEVITYSFVSEEASQLFFPDEPTKTLLNPISSELSTMRVSLLMGLVDNLRYNMNRQQQRIRIFETGLCFVERGEELVQEARIAGLIYGSREQESWSNDTSGVDFYDIKGDVEALCAVGNEFGQWKAGEHPVMHPGQCAELIMGGESAGFVGALHPKLQQSLNVKKNVYVFELKLAPLQHALLPWFAPISKFPEMRRDLAFTLKKDVQVAQIYTKVNSLRLPILRHTFVFDVYQDETMKEVKSVAMACIFQDNEQTLNDTAINDAMAEITEALVEAFAIQVRG